MELKVFLWTEMIKYIEKQVTIVLDDKPLITITGKLLSLDMEGNFSIDTDDGIRYGWPVLYLIVKQKDAVGRHRHPDNVRKKRGDSVEPVGS
ncbi:MAG: hypothetical protein HMLIMOIP_002562 [Candidatus Nitrosomirales archaeon]|jgi:hypothetical protein